MKLPLLSAATLAAIFSAPAIASDAGDIAVCQRIASALEAQRDALSSNPDLRPLSLLSQGRRPIIDMAAHPDEVRVSDSGSDSISMTDYERSFGTQYKPTPELAATVAQAIPYQIVTIESLPNEPLHALTSDGGSANCTEFVFFDEIPGHESQLAPDPPASMDGRLGSYTGGHREECYVSSGHLARIDGQSAFVVADYIPTGFGSDFRIATFGNGNWSGGCRTTLDFEAVYTTAKVTLEADSQLSTAELTQMAPALAVALDRAENGKATFAFGPPIPSALNEQVTKAEQEPIPKIIGGLPHTPPHPIYLQGRLYLVVAAHPEAGWRDLPGYVIHLYAFDGQSLSHAARLELTATRGRLLSVRANTLPDR